MFSQTEHVNERKKHSQDGKYIHKIKIVNFQAIYIVV